MKNILISGSTRGLGLEIAALFASKNYFVISTGRKMTLELEGLIKKFPQNIIFREFDLANHLGTHGFVNSITKEHGPIYGLINNAAVGADGVLATMHDTDIIKTVEINTTASLLLSKYCIRSMLLKQEGRVINIASIIANTGFSGLSVYAATKSSLMGFTKSLARELGKINITVNAVCPGYMETDMTQSISDSNLERIRKRSPMGKLVKPSDVAAYCLYLLSEEAKMITGTSLTIDAGSTA